LDLQIDRGQFRRPNRKFSGDNLAELTMDLEEAIARRRWVREYTSEGKKDRSGGDRVRCQ
jgi:hypothetical protein